MIDTYTGMKSMHTYDKFRSYFFVHAVLLKRFPALLSRKFLKVCLKNNMFWQEPLEHRVLFFDGKSKAMNIACM